MNIDFSFVDSPEFISFAKKHAAANPTQLRLKAFKGLPFDKNIAITQIACRKKAVKKIPELANRIVYPAEVSIEQCTSEILAKFHASLFENCTSVADLTCGLGIDSYYISQVAGKVASLEANPEIANAATFNFHRLGRHNIDVRHCRAEDFLETSCDTFSAMFADPSRRTANDSHSRILAIRDTMPDIATLLPKIKDKAKFIIVKASPMADVSQTVKDFPEISDVWILAVRNECKELLFKIDFQSEIAAPPVIHTLNFELDCIQKFSFRHNASTAKQPVRNPQHGDILIVPNAAIMKSGAFDALAASFHLPAIAANSHLFLSERRQAQEFPGKQYAIRNLFSLSKAHIREIRDTIGKASISCRNFPLSPDELRQRLKIDDGGEYHIFATTTFENDKILILCNRLSV